MKFLRALFFLFLLSFGATIFFLQVMGGGEGLGGPTEIQVESGMTVREISQALKQHGLVPSAFAFRLYLQINGLDTGVKTGTFSIPEDATFAEIAEILASAKGQEVTITIPEGYTVDQIDALLAENGLGEQGALLACAATCDFSSFDFLNDGEGFLDAPSDRARRLEGYLFPDTYFVNPNEFVPQLFLERMLGTFRTRIIEGLAEDLAVSERSLKEIVIMSSLIERETKTDEERPIVSGILWKRFDANQGLDVDATIRYALLKSTEPLTREDLENPSPYNTRKHVGLPPGPIANAGLQSIQAALHPKESPYWYYLHGKDGVIRYAETNDDHNANKARFL